MDIITELRERAASYRLGGPSSEHTATLLEKAADEIERLANMVQHAAAQGVTFPPDTLPRIPGDVIVECPVCKTKWEFDNHDNCPTCALAPQGVN